MVRLTMFQKSKKPAQLADGRWNCTGPEWPRFNPHLGCNLKKDCEGGEDEAQCRHTPCLDGGFQLDNRYVCLSWNGWFYNKIYLKEYLQQSSS